MADTSPTTLKQHDTWPPIRMRAATAAGALNLSTAQSLKFIANQVSGTAFFSGPAVAIQPADSEGMNASYTLAALDTLTLGDYACELEITWDAASSPPKIQTVPNTGTEILTIEADQG